MISSIYNSGKNDPMEIQKSLLSVQRRIEYVHFRPRKGTSKAAHICSMKSPPNQRKLPRKANDCKQVVVSAKRSFRRYFAWLTVIRVNECDYQLFARIFSPNVVSSSHIDSKKVALFCKHHFCSENSKKPLKFKGFSLSCFFVASWWLPLLDLNQWHPD